MDDMELEALAATLGITLAPEWRAGVRANWEVSVRMAAFVAAFPLEDEAELAPVFRA